ncbi:MAG TPA: GNAT family N-acetyltransferase [Tepidisphaeraceae bacterium]|jgi:ribosomal-protein-alanine N-acetyltransferase
MIEPTIRPAILDDAAELALVRVLAWRSAYRDILPAAFLAAMSVEDDERRWRDLMNRDGREEIVCTADGQIAGYATFGPARDGATATTAEVSAIYLRPDAWGRGWGRMLWQAALERLRDRGFADVMVWVLRDNSRARRFYERCGLRPDEERTVSIGGAELVEIRYCGPAATPIKSHPTLSTPRLLLRPWRDEDLAAFAAMNADPRVMEFLPKILSPAESDALAQRIKEHFERRGFGLWAVEIVGAIPFAGFVGLSVPAFEAHFTPCVEVGWRLAFECWGRGYATEAARGALDFGYGHVGLKEIVSFTVPANLRSRRVMERIGMTCSPADDFDHPRLPEGHPLRRHVLYRRRRSDTASGSLRWA